MFRTFRFGTELRRFGRTRMARLAIAAAICIPLLYGALYLWAFWNPTDHLDRVPVALVNADKGATKDDNHITAGRDLSDKLVDKRSVGWVQTTPEEARAGLAAGRYFAVLVIPPEFSQSVATMGTEHPVHAPLQVTYDDAQGYTARTILASVMREVRAAAGDAIGEGAVNKLFIGFSEIHSGMVRARDGADELAAGTAEARRGSGELSSGAGQLADGARTLATKTGEAADGAGQLHAGTSRAVTGSRELATGAKTLAAGSEKLATGSRSLADGANSAESGAQRLATGLDTMATQTRALPDQTRQLADGADQVAAGNRQLATKVTTATTRLETGLDELDRLAARLPDDDPLKPRFVAEVAAARARSTEARTSVEKLADGSEKVAAGNRQLAEKTPALSAGIREAATGANTLSSGLTTLSNGADTLATGAGELHTGGSKLSTGAGQLADGARQLDDGAARLDSGLGQLRDGAGTLAAKTGELHDGTIRLSDGLVKIDDGEHELAAKLGEAVGQVPNLSASERESNATVMSAPVTLDQSWRHEAASQGEGFAPYFIGLALYVGAMILWMLLRPISNRSLAAPVTALRVVLSNWLPAIILGIAQALLLMGVLIVGLGMWPRHLTVTLAFALLVSAAYVTLQQAFNIVFGPSVGRVVTLVVLTMQITSSGGTYPAETTPPFFQALHASLPLTQVVNGFRAAITGDLTHRFWYAVAYLIVLAVVSLVVSTAAAARNRVWSMNRLHPAISL